MYRMVHLDWLASRIDGGDDSYKQQTHKKPQKQKEILNPPPQTHTHTHNSRFHSKQPDLQQQPLSDRVHQRHTAVLPPHTHRLLPPPPAVSFKLHGPCGLSGWKFFCRRSIVLLVSVGHQLVHHNTTRHNTSVKTSNTRPRRRQQTESDQTRDTHKIHTRTHRRKRLSSFHTHTIRNFLMAE